jgi:ribosomal protein S21
VQTLLGSSFLSIISASLTPAILILATGSLVSSTLTRLARIVDRARILIERHEALRSAGKLAEAKRQSAALRMYGRRAALAERALSMYYTAIGLFVAACLAIMIDSLTHDAVPWLSLVLVVLGSLCLFAGTAALVIETHMATGILREEIGSARDPATGETSNA